MSNDIRCYSDDEHSGIAFFLKDQVSITETPDMEVEKDGKTYIGFRDRIPESIDNQLTRYQRVKIKEEIFGEELRQKYTIYCGDAEYSFNIDINKAVLEPFVRSTHEEARWIYKNWHKGAKAKYGDQISQNPANFKPINQAKLPNNDSLCRWVKKTAIRQCREFLEEITKKTS